MKVQIRNRCSDFNSYRAARVKSLFNCESGANFNLDAEIPDDSAEWKIGVVVGPSGSGKTSIGRSVWPDVGIYDGDFGWPKDAPIIDAIAPVGNFDDVAGALSAVGLGSVPAWLRPFHALSNGERFRAGLARIIAEGKEKVIIDEFTSVVDRQIAKIGASAFAKAWRRGAGKAILLSCHYDILDWIEPDWVFDTRTARLERGLLRRPKFDLEIWKTDGSYWPAFEPHHYLKLPRMVAAQYYVGFVDGEAVSHIAVSPRLEIGGMRACRMVVMPEWQGAGVGVRFLNEVCRLQFDPSANRFAPRVKAVYFHTSHPGLCAAMRRDKKWVQVSQMMGGGHKGKSGSSIAKSGGISAGYGGHHRAVQGFKFIRPKETKA